VDPNYVTGFVWTRQYGFRVVKSGKYAAIGLAVENPQLLYTASLAGNTPYAVLGSAGANGGNYNAGISSCSPSTSIVNYADQENVDDFGDLVHIAVPVYKTVNSCANIANLSFNQAPDVLVKAAFDPGWGHYEIFGIGGFAHETVYPGETTNSNLRRPAPRYLQRPPLPRLAPTATASSSAALAAACASPSSPTSSPSAPRASTGLAWAATATPRWPTSPPMPMAILLPSTISAVSSPSKPRRPRD
jgi:hypothetical protein